MPKVVIDLDEVYDVDEAANLLSRGVATIWRWIRDNKIVALRIGGRTLIPKSEIERLKNTQAILAERKQGSNG